MKRFYPFMFLVLIVSHISILPKIVYTQEGLKGKKSNTSKNLGISSALLDVNNIECYFMNDGSIGERPYGGEGFYFPAGQRNRSMIYTSGLWIIGKVKDELRSAVCCYGSEYQQGSILSPGVPDDPLDPKYKMYKYNRGDIIDTEAINQGCPDSVLGDQMVFCVYNDYKENNGMWGGIPMGLEVQQTAFAFNQPGALGNTIFIKFHITNKGNYQIDCTYIALWIDSDVGYCNDDNTGCDTTLKVGYVYNGRIKDSSYGIAVPALGCDLLQGPIIYAPGETAVLPNGTLFTDTKIMELSAFYLYFDSTPIPNLGDPHTPQHGYNYMHGLNMAGEPWLDPTQGDRPTSFPFAGDPVSNTGWIFSDFRRDEDVKIGLSCGPMTLGRSESKDLLYALVVGQGGDRFESINVMRYYDRQIEETYQNNFFIPLPPKISSVNVSELDSELMLYWDNEAVEFDNVGYTFQGYNIWQGESEAGLWTRIATFDVIDGITTIWDQVFSPALDAMVYQPVQFGVDSGIKTRFHIDKDYLNNVPLVNGRPYYFSVSTYTHNPSGIPRVYENEKTSVVAVPQRPVMDVLYNASAGDTIPVTHTGLSQGQVFAEVVDPAGVTGDDYEVSFFIEEDSTNEHFQETGWRMMNITTNDILLENIYDQSGENENTPVEGLLVTVLSPEPGILAFVQVANPTYSESMPDEQLDDAGRPYGGNNVWLSLSCPDDKNHNGRYFWSYDGAHIGDLSASHDYEIRWMDGVTEYSWGEWGFEDGNFDKVPFELWDIGLATPSDNSDDERMIPILHSKGTTTVWDVPSGNMAENNWGYACSDQIHFYYPDSGFTYFDFHSAAEAGDNTAANNMWGDVPCPFQRMVVINYTHEYTGPAPAAGSVDRILTNKPNSPMDVFSFSTKDYAPTKSVEVAKDRLKDINLFPNPYFGQNSLETDFYAQFVTFNNLPEQCTIRVFSLSGVLVKTIPHNNGTPFERWYLKNESERPVASGMYIIHVQTAFGDRILKFAFINREARYQHL